MGDQGGIPDFENEVRTAFDKQTAMLSEQGTKIQEGFDKLDSNLGGKLDTLTAQFRNYSTLMMEMLTEMRGNRAAPPQGQEPEQPELP